MNLNPFGKPHVQEIAKVPNPAVQDPPIDAPAAQPQPVLVANTAVPPNKTTSRLSGITRELGIIGHGILSGLHIAENVAGVAVPILSAVDPPLAMMVQIGIVGATAMESTITAPGSGADKMTGIMQAMEALMAPYYMARGEDPVAKFNAYAPKVQGLVTAVVATGNNLKALLEHKQ